jgi:TonB family protein
MRVPHFPRWFGSLASGAAFCIALVAPAQQRAASAAFAQEPPPAQQAPVQQSAPAAPAEQPPAAQPAPAQPSSSARAESAPRTPPISEDVMRQQFEGKTVYLRGGWLDDNLHFNQDGQLDGTSPRVSHTLSLVQITRVHLDKHHLELEGVRYGLHFLGAAPFEDQAVDRVRLFPKKKKPLHITIDREEVIVPKKHKPPKPGKKKPTSASPQAAGDQPSGQTEPLAAQPAPVPPPDITRHGAKVTTSQAEANKALRDAVDAVFASSIDQRMIATLPDFWKVYYKDVDLKQDFTPSDPAILRQSQVDKKARLISIIDPPSNDFAQKNGIAGMSMYHVVVEPDGHPGEIAIGRPIGFGLDEHAVDAIRKATFDPAIKNGKAVPVVVDLVVEFRIYSKLTDRAAVKSDAPQPPSLPGPYSVNLPKPSADQPPQPQ